MKSFSEYIGKEQAYDFETVSEAEVWDGMTNKCCGQEIESYSALIGDQSRCRKIFDDVAKALSTIVKQHFGETVKFTYTTEGIAGETRITFTTKTTYTGGFLKLFTSAYHLEYSLTLRENNFNTKYGAIYRYSHAPLTFQRAEMHTGINLFEGCDLSFNFETGKFSIKEK